MSKTEKLPIPMRNHFIIKPSLEEKQEDDKLVGIEKKVNYLEVLKTGPHVTEIREGYKVLIMENAMPIAIYVNGDPYLIFRETDVIAYLKS